MARELQLERRNLEHELAMKTTQHAGRRDAPFWAFVLVGAVSLGSLGCFVLAVAQSRPADVGILSPENVPPPPAF